MAQKQKAVVLFSGGVDSTTCLALAIERFGKDNVVPLSIQYGQKHSKELEAAAAILEHYGIEGKTMDVNKLFAFSNCSLLTQSSEEIPQGSYKEQQEAEGEGTVSTYVPFRNGLFLSAAASLALSLDCGYIYYGETRHRLLVEFDEEIRTKVRDIFAEMHKYYNQQYTPKVKTSKKYNACSLKDICLPVLNKKKSVAAYIDKMILEKEEE